SNAQIIIQDLNLDYREIDIHSKLDNNYVVKYIGSWMESPLGSGVTSILYIQMELCSHNLREVNKMKMSCFQSVPNRGMGHIEYFISYHLFKEILEAVEYLHTREPVIIHRDLKPTNIMILLNLAQKQCIKIGDFGLAKIHDKGSHTRNVGTDNYIAPEVISSKVYNTKADVYSIGRFMEELFNFDINE
ncbi:unnamed protein product, partial [Oppiella nova]